MARNFYCYKNETSGQYLIIPFGKVLGVIKQDKDSPLKIYIGDGTAESAFFLSEEEADNFTGTYENWILSNEV